MIGDFRRMPVVALQCPIYRLGYGSAGKPDLAQPLRQIGRSGFVCRKPHLGAGVDEDRHGLAGGVVAPCRVDHPMGGGEGRASGGHPRSRKGVPAKGFRTRSKNKVSNKYILERRKK